MSIYESQIIDVGIPNYSKKSNRFFGDPVPVPIPATPADKIAEFKALVADATALTTELKASFLLMEQLVTDLKVFLGK